MGTTVLVADDLDVANLGLKHFRLIRLKRIVAIAGANGSGKSRLLSYLHQTVSEANGGQEIESLRQQIKNQEDGIRIHIAAQQQHVAKQMNEHLLRLREQLRRAERIDCPRGTVVHVVSPETDLSDSWTQPASQIQAQATQAKAAGNNKSSRYTISYIQTLHDAFWNTSHQHSTASVQVKTAAKSELDSFQRIATSLLGQQIAFDDATRRPHCFGRPIADTGLSKGQQILLQLAVDLHAKRSSLSNAMIVFDEPENHLHPSAVIEVIERLSKLGDGTQVWIATHCIPLLAHLHSQSDASIYYMSEQTPCFAGDAPERVLLSLLGDAQRKSELKEYIGLPDQLAIASYSAECLVPPKAVDTSSDDPQIKQIRTLLFDTDSRKTIIDYGAGRGRLFSNIAVNAPDFVAKNLKYIGIERDSETAEVCRRNCAQLSPDAQVFRTTADLQNSIAPQSIDAVIMCNVLHEIAPEEWLGLFSNAHDVVQFSLKPDGKVLIVEDLAIPVGEAAHQYGFMVFDTAQLRILFDVSDSDVAQKKFVATSERNGRLKAHLIDKSVVGRITFETRMKAIQNLKKTAQSKIEEIRDSDVRDYKTGRNHGFWLAQFANSSLWISKQTGQ